VKLTLLGENYRWNKNSVISNMDQEKIVSNFRGLDIGRILYLETTTSTNEIASHWVSEGVPNYSLIIANEQTRGRGRAGRIWHTYPGTALAFSLVIYASKNTHFVSRYPGLGALAVWDAFKSLGLNEIHIKWPNDILIGNEKVCGILSEANWQENQLHAIILGIGINITKNSIPPTDQLNFPATYLEAHIAPPINHIALLRQIILSIRNWENSIDTDEFIHAWNQRLAYRGKGIKVFVDDPTAQDRNHPKNELTGILKGINQNGEILIQHIDGKTECYSANEIQFSP
jgi:BirA family biotin operon repressor/biotin-[acetyl-CoA-carboxylase] ligase